MSNQGTWETYHIATIRARTQQRAMRHILSNNDMERAKKMMQRMILVMQIGIRLFTWQSARWIWPAGMKMKVDAGGLKETLEPSVILSFKSRRNLLSTLASLAQQVLLSSYLLYSTKHVDTAVMSPRCLRSRPSFLSTFVAGAIQRTGWPERGFAMCQSLPHVLHVVGSKLQKSENGYALAPSKKLDAECPRPS